MTETGELRRSPTQPANQYCYSPRVRCHNLPYPGIGNSAPDKVMPGKLGHSADCILPYREFAFPNRHSLPAIRLKQRDVPGISIPIS